MTQESVILVDEEPGSAQLARDSLCRDGRYPVVELAPTARAAIEMAARIQPALVVFHVDLRELAMSDALRMVHAASPGSRVMVLPGCSAVVPETRGAAGRTRSRRGKPSRARSAVAEALTPPVGMAGVMSRKLAARPQSASEARRTVSEACTEAGEEPLLDDAHRIASELVSNAVIHTRTVIDLTIRAGGGAVRIEVGDGSHQRPTVHVPDLEALGGRGLLLVDALASVWGIDPSPRGKAMWAQLISPAPRPTPEADAETSVAVQNQFDGRWREGFVVSGTDGTGIWLNRPDGSPVPAAVPPGHVRPADPAPR